MCVLWMQTSGSTVTVSQKALRAVILSLLPQLCSCPLL